MLSAGFVLDRLSWIGLTCFGKCEVRSHIYTGAIISMKQQAEFAKISVIVS
jgi:hypothetical protein